MTESCNPHLLDMANAIANTNTISNTNAPVGDENEKDKFALSICLQR